MGSTKRNCRKEQSFAINYFNFLIIFFYSLRTSSKELIWCINYLNARVNTFPKRGSFIWGYFSLWISLSFLLPRGCISSVDYPVLKNTFWHIDTLTHWHINTLILFFLKKVDFKQICNFNLIEFSSNFIFFIYIFFLILLDPSFSTEFPGEQIYAKRTDSVDVWMVHQKTCRNSLFTENFLAKK